jgi:hypothetical protein
MLGRCSHLANLRGKGLRSACLMEARPVAWDVLGKGNEGDWLERKSEAGSLEAV